jgi:hypothetical protein
MNLPGWMGRHRTLTIIVSLVLATSLVPTCNLGSSVMSSIGIGDVTVPDTFTPEALAQTEQDAWAIMTAPIVEALGPDGNSLLAAYAIERRAMLSDLM